MSRRAGLLSSKIPVVCFGSGSSSLIYLEHNGNQYGAGDRFEVTAGDEVYCRQTAGAVWINGSKMSTSSYTWTIPRGASLIVVGMSTANSSEYTDDQYGGAGIHISSSPSYFILHASGSGNATYCYTHCNGDTTNKVAGAGLWTFSNASTLTYHVYGRNTTNYGYVVIDDVEVLRVTDQTTKTYAQDVSGARAMSIVNVYTSSTTTRKGRITATTVA